MTKKDYIVIARIIHDMPDHAPTLRAQRASTAAAFADALAADNPRFDHARFLAACGVENQCAQEPKYIDWNDPDLGRIE